MLSQQQLWTCLCPQHPQVLGTVSMPRFPQVPQVSFSWAWTDFTDNIGLNRHRFHTFSCVLGTLLSTFNKPWHFCPTLKC